MTKLIKDLKKLFSSYYWPFILISGIILNGCEKNKFDKENKKLCDRVVEYLEKRGGKEIISLESKQIIATLEEKNYFFNFFKTKNLKIGLEKDDFFYAFYDFGADGLKGNDRIGGSYKGIPLCDLSFYKLQNSDKLIEEKRYKNTLKDFLNYRK